MAFRLRRKVGPTVKAFYDRQRLLASSTMPVSLKLTMLGYSKQGGYLTRLERQRRKLPRQLKGLSQSRLKRRLY